MGFQRDLLTGAAYGVDRILFVGGDKPSVGSASGDLSVRASVDAPAFRGAGSFTVGVAAGLSRALPRWKANADFTFVQVSHSVDDLVRWRERNPVDMPVYAGVMVLASAGMARRLAASIPAIAIPDELVRRVEVDPGAGVEAVYEQIAALRIQAEELSVSSTGPGQSELRAPGVSPWPGKEVGLGPSRRPRLLPGTPTESY